MELRGKTAKEIVELVNTGTVTKESAVEHLFNNGVKRVGKGRKPTFPSLKALEGFTGKDIKTLREEINAKAGAKPAETKPKKPKASKTSHDALDKLSVAYVEADVCKLVNAKTTKAAIARMNAGQIKDPQKVANLREAERRLGYETPNKPVQPDANARIDALESKLDEILRIFS